MQREKNRLLGFFQPLSDDHSHDNIYEFQCSDGFSGDVLADPFSFGMYPTVRAGTDSDPYLCFHCAFADWRIFAESGSPLQLSASYGYRFSDMDASKPGIQEAGFHNRTAFMRFCYSNCKSN